MKLRQIITATLLTVVAITCAGQTPSGPFHEAIIQQLMANPDIDKNVLINRSPDNRSKVESASYNFKFSSADTFNKVRAELVKRSRTADFFRQTTGKNETILMRVSTSDGNTSSYKLQRLGRRNFLFIVNVNPSSALNQRVEISTDQSARAATAAARREAQQARRQAQQARQQAQQNRRSAMRSKNGTLERRDNEVTADKRAEINQLQKQLEQERQERERELK